MASNTEIPSGYDYVFIEDVPEDYICCICHLTMRNPVQTKCGHRFCKDCLNTANDGQSGNLKCQVDDEELAQQDIFPDKATERKILTFQIKCPSDGCVWQGKLSSVQVHIVECPMSIVPCSYGKFGCEYKGKRSTLNDHIIGEHLASTTTKLLELQDKNADLKRQLSELKDENENLKKEFLDATVSIMTRDEHSNLCFIWKIKDFNKKLQNAKQLGRYATLYSDPFYTNKYGYKLKLLLYPNGQGEGKGTHISVFMIVMRGEYDALLPWPFRYKIKFILVDQKPDLSKRKNLEMSFSSDFSSEHFKRPTTDENSGRGFSTCFSHDIFTKELNYVVDETLFLKLELEKQGFTYNYNGI